MFFTKVAIILSVIFWLIESILHRFLFSGEEFEFLPSDINELWMRIIIVLLIVALGIYTDKHTKALLKKEKEKRIIYNATMHSTQHILNNLLNQMQYFESKAESTNAFDERTKDLYHSAMQEGKALAEQLSKVDELSEESIKTSIQPK